MSDGSSRRYFSIAEANAMIVDLERAFGRMVQMKNLVRDAYGRLEEVGFAPGGDEFDIAPEGAGPGVVNELSTLKTLIDALKLEMRSLNEAGCIVKDIDAGIVDWYALRGDRDVLLCWKLGEKEIGYWHDPEAGFAGRRPISELVEEQG